MMKYMLLIYADKSLGPQMTDESVGGGRSQSWQWQALEQSDIIQT